MPFALSLCTHRNALQWIASSKLHIRNISHVLDDFLLLARDKAVGQAQLSAFLSMCADIGAFNGKSLMLPQYWLQSPSIDLYTDASGTLGYGAVLGPQRLFGRWDDGWRGQSITLLEFYPIVLAVSVWSYSLSNKCISFHSDNRALVDIINSQTSKDTKVKHLMRKLVLSVCVTTSSSEQFTFLA